MISANFELIFGIFILIIYFYGLILFSSERRINKKELWDKINKAIKNNANAEVLNDIVRNQKRVKRLFNRNLKLDYYPNLISLNEILEDMRSNEYIKDDAIDNELIEKINSLIEEDKKKSPFDGLEDKQKDFFENIVNIMDEDNFSKIQNNINKISNELALKSEEAKKAKLNFKIALVSIAITIAVGIYQIYDSSQTKKDIFINFKNLEDALHQDNNTSKDVIKLTKQSSQ